MYIQNTKGNEEYTGDFDIIKSMTISPINVRFLPFLSTSFRSRRAKRDDVCVSHGIVISSVFQMVYTCIAAYYLLEDILHKTRYSCNNRIRFHGIQ